MKHLLSSSTNTIRTRWLSSPGSCWHAAQHLSYWQPDQPANQRGSWHMNAVQIPVYSSRRPSTAPKSVRLKSTGSSMASTEDATAQQAVDIQVSTPPQRAPIEGSILSSDRLPTPQELQIWLLDALHAAQNFAKQHPEVQNVDKLCRRIKRDLAFVQRFLPAADIEPSSPTASPLQQQPTSSPHAPQQPPMAASDGDQAQPHASKPEPEAESHAPGEMSLVRMQGIVNNLRGFNGELQAAMEAPQVVAVSRRFSSVVRNQWKDEPPVKTGKRKGGGKAGSSKAGNAGAGGAGAGAADGAAALEPVDSDGADDSKEGRAGQLVEVDVVAQGGLAWVEVKAHERFGLDSVHWLGAAGHVKGLRRQLQEALQVAQAPCNQVRWQAPYLVVYFPAGADPLVAQEIRSMGILVAEGPGALAGLPSPPPLPPVANLDVTTMCALVSEVSHGGCDAPSVEAWSQRNVHWRECVLAERRSPVLRELSEYLGPERQLVACSAAVQQFESLLDMHGGPREVQRWQQLKARLAVHEQDLQAGGASSSKEVGQQAPEAGAAVRDRPEAGAAGAAAGAAGAAEAMSAVVPLTGRIRALEKVTLQQRAVFGLGDVLQVVTLTANGNAVRCAERQGVQLEAVLHRAVWLAGL